MRIQFFVWDAQSNSFKRDFYAEDFWNRYDIWWESHL